MKKTPLLLTAFILMSVVLVCLRSTRKDTVFAADQKNIPKLKVLIITPDPATGYANGIQTLLRKSGLQTEVVSWDQATDDTADNYDVLVVTGLGRSPRGAKIRLDYHKPIVAYGPYGCKYLGMSHLKNGHPYT
jgi:hypothetical protein